MACWFIVSLKPPNDSSHVITSNMRVGDVQSAQWTNYLGSNGGRLVSRCSNKVGIKSIQIREQNPRLLVQDEKICILLRVKTGSRCTWARELPPGHRGPPGYGRFLPKAGRKGYRKGFHKISGGLQNTVLNFMLPWGSDKLATPR